MAIFKNPILGRKVRILIMLVFLTPALYGAKKTGQSQYSTALIKETIDYYRGKASVSKVDMTIHRPDWERTMTIKAWTRGRKDSLFFIVAPPKDEGNGTLKRGPEMWIYNPKVNQVIKLPPSMMSQPWMGSDFSNNDLAKSDSVIEDYDHFLESVETSEGLKVYVVKSIPKPGAAVVWGMQRLFVREDKILIREEFYDEDLRLVKTMTGTDIRMLGGKLFPRIWRMQKADAKDEYTQLEYQELEFVDNLPNRIFSISSLKNVGR